MINCPFVIPVQYKGKGTPSDVPLSFEILLNIDSISSFSFPYFYCDLFFTVILVVNDRFTVGMVSQRSCDEAAYQTGINPGGMVFLADVPAENDFIIGFTLFYPT